MSNTSAQACLNMNITRDAMPSLTASNREYQTGPTAFRIREGKELAVFLNGFKPSGDDAVTISSVTTLVGASPLDVITTGSNATSMYRYVCMDMCMYVCMYVSYYSCGGFPPRRDYYWLKCYFYV